MVSRLLRRSGVAIVQVVELLNWIPDFVYQIGVGINHMEVDVMRECWPDVKFIGHEPQPEIYHKIKDDYPGELHQQAISNYCGKGQIHTRPRHDDGSSLFPLNDCPQESVNEVEVTTLDKFHGKPKGRSLLWLDCEGSELDTLIGGDSFLKDIEVINVETTASVLGAGFCDVVDLHHWFKDNGFFRQSMHTQRIYVGQLDIVYVRPDLFLPEICCCPCDLERYRNLKGVEE